MSLQVRYNRVTTAAGVQPDTITARMGVAFQTAAEEGAVAVSSLVIDDTTSALPDYVGLRRVYAYETAAPAHSQIVYNGYIQDRTISRLPSEGMDSDNDPLGRRWSINIADTNSLLSRRILTGTDANRPAETDVARLQWLLSDPAHLSNPTDNWYQGPYFSTASPVNMTAIDYRGQRAFDVLNDCAQRSGKNWFAWYDESTDTVPPTNAGHVSLFYDFDYSATYTSTLRLTNVRADVDNSTTFAVNPDAVLHRDPTRVYSGDYLSFNGTGSPIYVQSTNVANLFQRRDAAVNNPYVTTVAEATALANRYLADAATEDDRITCRFVVPKQNVNDLREGMRVQAKFTHFPNYSSAYTYMRCLRRTVVQLTDDFYEISVELTPAENSAVTIVQSVGTASGAGNTPMTMPNPVTAGNLLVIVQARRAGGAAALHLDAQQGSSVGPTRSFTQIGSTVGINAGGGHAEGQDAMAMAYRVATGDEQTLVWLLAQAQMYWWELANAAPSTIEVLAATLQAASGGKSLGSFTTAATGDIQLAGFEWWNGDTPTLDETVGTGWTQDQQVNDLGTGGGQPQSLAMHSATKPAATISGGAWEWAGIAINVKRP